VGGLCFPLRDSRSGTSRRTRSARARGSPARAPRDEKRRAPGERAVVSGFGRIRGEPDQLPPSVVEEKVVIAGSAPASAT
jgi:hypothetical protein